MKYVLQMLIFRWTKVRAGRRDLEPPSGTLSNKSTKQPGSAGTGMTREILGNGVKTDNQKTASRSKQEKREP